MESIYEDLDNIENASDEEILEMTRAEGLDPVQEADKIRATLLTALTVVESKYLPKKLIQIRFPCSKSRRIRKKWSKNPANWREVEQVFLISKAVLDKSLRLDIENAYKFEESENAFESRYLGYWNGIDSSTGKIF